MRLWPSVVPVLLSLILLFERRTAGAGATALPSAGPIDPLPAAAADESALECFLERCWPPPTWPARRAPTAELAETPEMTDCDSLDGLGCRRLGCAASSPCGALDAASRAEAPSLVCGALPDSAGLARPPPMPGPAAPV